MPTYIFPPISYFLHPNNWSEEKSEELYAEILLLGTPMENATIAPMTTW